MQKPVGIVMIGAGGYGHTYISMFQSIQDQADKPCELLGVVDPYVKAAKGYDWLVEQGIPLYDSMEEFYAARTAELALIATPIPLHAPQSICAMAHGSHVLVEKPLCSTVQEAVALEEASKKYGKFLAVGYQWCYSKPVLDLKRDIQAGVFGRPLHLKAFCSWKRFLSYYDHTWKGKYHDGKGNWILDCVITNATAHYLQNLLFVMGDKIDSVAMPLRVLAEAYRVKPDMETPDVFALRGELPGDVPFWFATSYSLTGDETTQFRFSFEKADLIMNVDQNDYVIYAQYPDGRRVPYQNPIGDEERGRKMMAAIQAVRDPSLTLPCTVSTALPHIRICNGIMDRLPPQPIAQEYLVEYKDPDGVFAHTLRDNLLYAMAKGLLPSELGFVWAKPPIEFNPAEVERFDGSLFL